jgi:NAD(P)H-flavin reductase/hemoglobin-like flavoprotein
MDSRRLKENFAQVAAHGDAVPLFFYADLFLRHPQTRDMFPVAMNLQRDRLVQALARIVSDVDNLDELIPYLKGLGRDHRKFGALADHYAAVGTSLIATLRHFSGPGWSIDLESDWTTAYTLVAKVMVESAADDERTYPAWWDATVVSHELRSYDTAVLRVVTSKPLPYLPGQSVTVEAAKMPRIWRLYSVANAPRVDRMLEFHVRMVDGGLVSPVLAYGTAVGSWLRLGPAVGGLRLAAAPGRDILMVGGGTGLAPLKAIIEQLADFRDPPRVRLFYGARSADGLYDLPDLEKKAAQWPWLTVTSAVSEDPDYPGERGLISDVVARHGAWDRHEAYVAGPPAMVEATVGQLTSAGVAEENVHFEDFDWGMTPWT